MAILAIANPTYKPSMRIISAITNAFPAAITTTFNHNYVTGTVVRLFVPAGYGMLEAHELFGPITVTGDTTFTVKIDTTNFGVYITPSGFPDNAQYAQVVPIGEINSILTAATENALPY